MQVKPYPLATVPTVRSEAVAPLRRWARTVPWARWQTDGERAREWLGAAIVLSPGVPEAATPRVTVEPACSVVLEHAGGTAGLALDREIAAAVVARTLGGESPEGSAGPLRAVERGVLTYALARWLGESGWQVGDVFAYAPAMFEALGKASLVRWPFEISLGSNRRRNALWLPMHGAPAPRPSTRPEWASEIPLTVRALIGDASLPASTLARLEAGDVLIPDRISLASSGRGHVDLRFGRARWRAQQDGDAWKLLGREEREAERSRGGVMDTRGGSMEEFGDTPVALTLEVARFELPLGDVAALGVGEVVRSGVPLDGRVTLRAGNRAIATGELVSIDGELGVRITALA